MRCKACHYSLANLPENRCPECGTAFDPTNPATYFTPKVRKPIPWRLVAAAAAFYVIAAMATLIWNYLKTGTFTGGNIAYTVGFFAGMSVASLVLLSAFETTMRSFRDRFSRSDNGSE